MKRILLTLSAAGLASFLTLAGPVPAVQIDSGAQWLLHLDLDAFRASQIGGLIARDRIEPRMTQAAAEIKAQLGVDFDWTRIRGVTAYGTSFARPGQTKGVLLLDTDLDVKASLDAAIARQPEGAAGKLRLIETGPNPIYWAKDEYYVALIASGPVIVGKLEDEVRRARDVVLGSVPNLSSGNPFVGYSDAGPGLVFYGAAQGFNGTVPIPPRAQVLKLADGLCLWVSEAGGNLVVNLSLKAKTAEASQQVQQVVQGLLALAALSQGNNPDLQELAQGVRVSGGERLATIELSYPVEKALQKIQERRGAKSGF